MKIFYVTFGQKSPFRNGYVKIEAENYIIARELAFQAFERNWSSIYSSEDFYRSQTDNTTIKDMFPDGQIGEILK